ncbi:hypothetical protein SAMN04488104_100526 [Algoriphagus faecimaris]|uniref:Lipoprotein n=1 Tax=Algoriphagus faecimaris TaxID=686796 RepID=A0A1G6P513_9BACT|nr:hypothetical protein [Algoriphagus faecimaris]SDC74527.1 hypothetical protein SAMN04488104_100526 [Algoriphagus faecimaris]
MKKAFLYFCGLLMLACVPENEPSVLEDALEEALKTPNNGVVTFGEKTYIFNQDSNQTISKFVKSSKAYDFTISPESMPIDVNSTLENYRTSGESFLIENEETGEFIRLVNIQEVSANEISFDVEASNGVNLEGFNLQLNNISSENSNLRTTTCWWCIALPVLKLAEAIIDSLGPNIDSNCELAITTCASTGGIPEVELTDDWFGKSCSVECKIPS